MGLHASGLQYSQWKICNYLRHSDWTNKKCLETQVGKHSRGLAGHVLSRRMVEGVLNLSLARQHSGWEHRPRYEPAQNTNEILIISLVCHWDEPGRVPTGRPVSGLRKKERGERDDRMRPWPLLSVERETATATARGGEIKRVKKPQSPLTPCLTPVIHWDTSFWPALIHDCSAQQLSTNQQAESPLTPHAAQLSSAWETNWAV